MRLKRYGVIALACASGGGALWAQARGGGSEWLTAQGDAQRTSWIRTDAVISVEGVSKPEFELQWESKLDNQPRHLTSLSQGVTANGVTLFVPISVVTGSSNNVYAIDNETGYTVWHRHFEAPLPPATAACPGGITSPATRIVPLTPPPMELTRTGGSGGRGGYRSSIGQPGEGAPVEGPSRGAGPGRGAVAAPAAPPAASGAAPAQAGAAAGPQGRGIPPGTPAAGAAPGGAPPAGAGAGAAGAGGQRGGADTADAGIPGAPGGGGPGSGYGRPGGVVYTVASDGMLHVLGMQTGKDLQKPAPFLPANARATDLIAVNRTLYAATSGECGGAPNGVWALDLASEAKPVTSWKTNGGGVAGLAFATDGTLLATVGPGKAAAGGYANAIVALDAKTLQPKDWFTDSKIELASMPLVFKSHGRDMVAAAARDGRILLLDAASLGGSNHSTPLHISRPFATGSAFAPEALATWQEATATGGGSAGTAPGTTGAAQAPAPQGAPPAGVPQGPLTTLPAAPGTPGGPAAGSAGPTSPAGTRWLLVPVTAPLPADAQVPGATGVKSGAVLALKVIDQGGKLSLEPGWISRDLPSPATPLVVNGVVFALAGGKPQETGGAPPSDLAKRGSPAVLYALNGRDGKELWSSGKRMTSFLSARSFWSATGQVYVGTYDGTLYAFGPAMDRR